MQKKGLSDVMNKRKISKYFVAGALACMFSSNPASAQSIDYGLFEMMFGEPVTTSATGKPQRVSEVPLSMEILTAEEITRTGAKTIPDALRHVQGLNVHQTTETQQEVGMRGYGGNYTDRILVLINGRQVFLDYYGLVVWETIPVQLSEIRQIEVVKGPNTALFGFNAVGGVINIVTYNPMNDDIDNAFVTLGTQENARAGFVHTVKVNDKIGIRYSLSKGYMGTFDEDPISGALAGGNPITLHQNSDRTTGNVDGLIQVNDNTQVTFEVSSSQAERNEGIGTQYAHFDYKMFSYKASLKQENDWGLWDATFYKNEVKVQELGLDYNDVWVAQISDLFTVGNNHVFRVMAEYRDNRANVLAIPALNARTQFDVMSGSGMWNWTINDKWSMNNAVRYDSLSFDYKGDIAGFMTTTEADYDNRDVKEVSVNSGVVYQHDEQNTMRVSFARGIDIPSFLEFATQTAFFQGSPNAPVSIVTNYELGYDHKFTKWDALLKASVYYQETGDVQFFAGFPQTPLNGGKTAVNGFEIGLEGRLDENWGWGGNYSYANVNDHELAGFTFNTEKSEPQGMANIWVNYDRGPWQADAYLTYYSDYQSSRLNGVVTTRDDIDRTMFLNLRVNYEVNDQFDIELFGKNITTGDHYQEAIQELEPQVYLTGKMTF